MKKSTKSVAAHVCAAALVISALSTSGCQTAGGSAATGGAVGAGLGAIIGNQSGHAGGGALIGLAAGALTGLIVHDVKTRRQRSARDTYDEYEYTPALGQRLTLEEAYVEPYQARRGEVVEARARFAILGTGSGVQMTESWVLRDDSGEIKELSSYTVLREDGTWESSLPFRVPSELPPGNYHIAYNAQTTEIGASGRANFVVY